MLRARTLKTEAIVLRQQEFGEADRMLTLVTPMLGKLRVLAKGVRRATSRKAGHVELFVRADMLLSKGRDMHLVTQADTIAAHRPVRENLERSSYATYFAELLDRFTPEQESSPDLYQLFSSALGWLSESAQPELTARYFEAQLLGLAGYQPELRRCVVRGCAITARAQYFDPLAGGVACPPCGSGRAGVLAISLGALKVLRHMESCPHSRLMDLRVSPGVARELELLLLRYITVALERSLKSVDFLNHVRRTASA